MNNTTENWIEKVNSYIEQKPDLIPFYIDKPEFDKDRIARNSMKPILNRLASITESVEDTSKLLSTDIYNAAIAYYRNIKLISMQNVPGTTNSYDDLSNQFPGRSIAVSEQPENTDNQSGDAGSNRSNQ